MNIRPRCRDWLPLSTQQLRLRNLQAIQGVNIELESSNGGCFSTSSVLVKPDMLLYFTLHEHANSHPFYQSEELALRKHLNLKWAEIQCPEIIKSNANCVCIKVWATTKKTELEEKVKDPSGVEDEENSLNGRRQITETMGALAQEFIKLQKLPMPSDTLVFTWAVYFSGLVPFTQNSEFKCCTNCLIFQMNDEYFGSPELFSAESLREQLALNYARYSASVPKCSIPSPDEFAINSPQVSRSSSPIAVDWQKDLLRMSKTRYVHLNCVHSEVRCSYDLNKLLKLQQLQRQRLQTQREIIEMTSEIKRLSIRCITKEQLSRKPRTTSLNSSNSLSSSSTAFQYHSMGRTLSLLLAEQQNIDPEQLLRAQKLQMQLESLKSKQRLLKSVQETFSKRIAILRQQLDAATTSRRQLQNWLSVRQRKLQEDETALENLQKQQLKRRQRRFSLTQHVERIMSSLCLELRDIYPIARNSYGLYTICDLSFPKIDGYVLDSLNTHSVHNSENITPMALSASLGYVAHLVEMISVVLNRPLRNPIIYEGSRTRIMDVIKDIPYTSREFPLYSRSSLPTKPVKYAINLLNQNIAQLCFDTTGMDCDVRATIDNLLHIFGTLSHIEQIKKEIHSDRSLSIKHLAKAEVENSTELDHNNYNHQAENYTNYHQNQSKLLTKNGEHDYMMPPPISVTHHHHHNVPIFSLTTDKLLQASRISSQPIDIQQDRSVLITTTQHRSCRSVGSYTDSEDEVCHSAATQYFSSSDSNLTSLQSGGHNHV